MSFLGTVRQRVGTDLLAGLEKVADYEVGIAKAMPLQIDGHDQYYKTRFLLDQLLDEARIFEAAGLKVSPVDVVNILFRCKLLCACQAEEEYGQRRGGFPFLEDSPLISWSEKGWPLEKLIEKYMDWLESKTAV